MLVSCGKVLHVDVLKTAMACRIKCPLHISLLNSSQKASQYATRRQINSADGNIVAYASFGSKLQKLRQRYKLQKDKVEKEGMARQKKKKTKKK